MAVEAEVELLKHRVEYLEEMVKVLAEKELSESIKRGLQDIHEGRVISLEEYEKSQA
jgi:hypothetical protein